MIVLDTNVLSALMQQTPEERVVAWLDRQPRTSVWTTAITVLEVRHRLLILSAGRRRSSLIEAFDALLNKIERRIAAFDVAAAEEAANLMAERQRGGRHGDLRDTMIAGIVLASHGTLATRNTTHFQDLSVPMVNPWAA